MQKSRVGLYCTAYEKGGIPVCVIIMAQEMESSPGFDPRVFFMESWGSRSRCWSGGAAGWEGGGRAREGCDGRDKRRVQ